MGSPRLWCPAMFRASDDHRIHFFSHFVQFFKPNLSTVYSG